MVDAFAQCIISCPIPDSCVMTNRQMLCGAHLQENSHNQDLCMGKVGLVDLKIITDCVHVQKSADWVSRTPWL